MSFAVSMFLSTVIVCLTLIILALIRRNRRRK